MSDSMYMIVVLISEGRSFPKRSQFQLLFEAKFDGELLATDGVDHVEVPEVTQELAWQINKKSLQQHKLHRTPIKILCYCVDMRTSAREQIGYFMLDIRSAPAKPSKKWYPLLNTKYKKSKPELRVAVYIEAVQNTSISAGITSAQDKSHNTGLDESEVDITQLKPELNELEGYFQLGPANRCKDVINISVTVAFAGGLTELLPSNRNVTIDPEGFYFFYTIFNNDVITEKFLDLIDPKFSAERATIRIRSSVDILRYYLQNQPPVQFHLCTGTTSLGSAEVSLSQLLKDSSLSIPVEHEGSFELVAPAKYEGEGSGNKAVLGLSICIYKDELMEPVKNEQPPAASAVDQKPVTSSPVKTSELREDVRNVTPDTGSEASNKTEYDYTETFDSEKKTPEDVQQKRVDDTNSPATTDTHSIISEQPRKYTFTLHLQSIKMTEITSSILIFIRYRYSPFGAKSPIQTHPAVSVYKNAEVKLRSRESTMEFTMIPTQLIQTVHDKQFVLELWSSDSTAGNKCIGKSALPLQELLSQKSDKDNKRRLKTTIGACIQDRGIGQNSYDDYGYYDYYREVGDIQVECSITDHGEVKSNLIKKRPSASPRKQTTPTRKTTPTKQTTPPEQTAEYKAALQLEMWKETQEQLFEQQLKEKAAKHLASLSEEFKKRDSERELLCKKKVAENADLQKELQKSVNLLTKKEKQMSERETQLVRLEADLKHSYDRLVVDLQEATKRMQAEKEHAISLARARTTDCEETISRLKSELSSSAVKYTELEKEFQLYKEQQNNKPEVKLHAEINLLTLEKVELERKLEACNKSRAHYKLQWGKALKENAQLVDKSNQQERDVYLKQNQELELIKQRILAAEEKEILKTEKRELNDIKEEIERQKKLASPVKSTQTAPTKQSTALGLPTVSCLNKSQEEHLSRLQLQRDELLRTGVYSTDDPIIIELEKQIRLLISSIDQPAA